MNQITFGQTTVPFELRKSENAGRIKLEITLDGMKVTAPSCVDDEGLKQALYSKRKWIVVNHHQMLEKKSKSHKIARFQTGAKIPYWGRLAKLTITPSAVEQIHIGYRNGFHVEVPDWLSVADQDQVIEQSIQAWMKEKLRMEAQSFAKKYSAKLDLPQPKLRVIEFKNMWGSCGEHGTVSLDWHLIFAPKRVTEYAVAHEVTHLKERSHTPAFWACLKGIFGEFEQQKTWLDTNEHLLGYSKIELENFDQRTT